MAARAWQLALLLASFGLRGVARAGGASGELPETDSSVLPAARPAETAPPREERWNLHFQTTIATQYHPGFHARYSGANSMMPDRESATAVLSTGYLDLGLWPGAELVFNPELSGGRGLSKSLGVAAFPSGIVYRVGNPAPTIYLARLELRQTIGLGGGKVTVEPGANQLAGKKDRDTLTFFAGRLALMDIFDSNAYAHDPTRQFFNWALFASGAWDYAADTRGYNWGLFGDLSVDRWSVRAGIALEPKYANQLELEWRVWKSQGLQVEGEARYKPGGRRGAARLLGFLNSSRAGSYQQVLDDRGQATYGNSVAATRAFGRKKWGFALSVDQELNESLGAFARLSYNDGKTESWAFTEIDRSFGVGLVQNGRPWRREGDEVGAAVVINGLSDVHRRYLAGGGYGFIIGDGALDNYGLEVVGDLYYRARLVEGIWLSSLYQPIIDPAYNRDRGPIHVFSGRLQAAFLPGANRMICSRPPRRLALAALLASAACLGGCNEPYENVCEDIGNCSNGGDSVFIEACQKQAKTLRTEADASDCAALFDAYYSCADKNFTCEGASSLFPGCDQALGPLQACLASSEARNACGKLADALAACSGGGAGGAGPGGAGGAPMSAAGASGMGQMDGRGGAAGGASPPGPGPGPPCSAGGVCEAQCYLDTIANVCAPVAADLAQFAQCSQRCTF